MNSASEGLQMLLPMHVLMTLTHFRVLDISLGSSLSNCVSKAVSSKMKFLRDVSSNLLEKPFRKPLRKRFPSTVTHFGAFDISCFRCFFESYFIESALLLNVSRNSASEALPKLLPMRFSMTLTHFRALDMSFGSSMSKCASEALSSRMKL